MIVDFEKSICFVAPSVANIFHDGGRLPMGGADVQQFHIANFLKAKGWRVSFVAHDEGLKGRGPQTIEGIDYFGFHPRGEGLRVVGFLHPYLTDMWRAMRDANASIYYQRSAGLGTGIVATFRDIYNRLFIYAGASDTDFMPENLRVSTIQDKIGYRYGIRRADLVTVQNRTQRSLLKKHWGIDGALVPNALPDVSFDPGRARGKYFLWVGGLRSVKRPEIFARLARACPGLKFVMICGGANERTAESDRLRELLRKIPNLDYLDHVGYRHIDDYFRSAVALVNTSAFEGFPNTFLEALRLGVPIISCVDPDGIIEDNSLGAIVRSEKELIERVLQFGVMDLSSMSSACRAFFGENHSFEVVGAKIDSAFSTLVSQGRKCA